MGMSLLKDATVYLSGPIEASSDPNSWRNQLRPKLEALGLVVWDPLIKPNWMHQVSGPEQASWKNALLEMKIERFEQASGLYSPEFTADSFMSDSRPALETIKQKNKQIRDVCLAITNACDLMIVKVDKNVFTVGTWEEVVVAAQQNKPVLFWVDGPRNFIPSMWLVDMFDAYDKPEDVFFTSDDTLLDYLNRINDGTQVINNIKWAFRTYGGFNDRPNAV